MIDLHCHLLPGVDDGSVSLETSLEMARIAIAEGIQTTACTPHIYPGLFDNHGPDIRERVDRLGEELGSAGIGLGLSFGADIQIVPELLAGLRSGDMPTLGGSRYFLFEPPHHSVPPAFSRLLFDSLAAGYVPIVTHPERLSWLDEEHYSWFVEAVRQGAWMQLTSAAVTGHFGRTARYWSERFLGDGLVHVLATDGHDPRHRPPLLAEGVECAQRFVGAEEASRLVLERPAAVLANLDPGEVPLVPGLTGGVRVGVSASRGKGFWARLFGS